MKNEENITREEKSIDTEQLFSLHASSQKFKQKVQWMVRQQESQTSNNRKTICSDSNTYQQEEQRIRDTQCKQLYKAQPIPWSYMKQKEAKFQLGFNQFTSKSKTIFKRT